MTDQYVPRVVDVRFLPRYFLRRRNRAEHLGGAPWALHVARPDRYVWHCMYVSTELVMDRVGLAHAIRSARRELRK